MSKDLIKRSDAIKAVNREKSDWNCDYNVPIDNCIKRLNKVRSADRPRGEWKKHDGERDYCSRCKHIFKTRTITQQDKWTQYIDDLGYNYCPNCGAQMKREGE